jgi:PAS domain S-box-containing protein
LNIPPADKKKNMTINTRKETDKKTTGPQNPANRRRGLEEDMALAAKDWQDTFDRINAAIWILDKDQRILRSNKAAEIYFHRPRNEFVGRHCWEIVHGTAQPHPECPILPARKNLRRQSVELQVNGAWLEVTVDPIQDSVGQFAGAVHIVSDISERKRLEKEMEANLQSLQAKNEELERFTYSVSHDLKSPLVTIRTFLGHLKQDMATMDKEKIKEDLDYIINGAEKMSRLLDELLNLSRIGHKPNPPEDVPLQTIVREALDLVAGRLTELKAEVNITKTELMVHGDRTRLVEVFQNLLDNACKFMGEQKSPLIEIGVEKQNDETVIFVRDNGSGITPQFLPKIFVVFEKLNRGSEGDGIGLALVKRIVEVHGGHVWVESAGPGLGTCFKFTLAGKHSGKLRSSAFQRDT